MALEVHVYDTVLFQHHGLLHDFGVPLVAAAVDYQLIVHGISPNTVMPDHGLRMLPSDGPAM